MNRKSLTGITLLAVGIVGLLGTWAFISNELGRSNFYARYPIGRNPSVGQPLVRQAKPITLDQAVELAQQYVASLHSPDLAVREVMEFELNFYFIVYEKSTGVGAFEMLIDGYGGWIKPEQGPNMMWNTKYGMMSGMGGMMGRGGMMDWNRGTLTPNMSVTKELAELYAKEYLKSNLPGASIEEADVFYGYYTIHVLKGDMIHGMLSVNGYTGQIWYHSWHGSFISMRELQ